LPQFIDAPMSESTKLSMDSSNIYSDHWYSIFMRPIGISQTQAEVDFITRHLPIAEFRSIIDLCCGTGRHASLLASHGYQVLGLDSNTKAIAEAQSSANERLKFLVHDMRQIALLPGSYDAVMNLWQSFGYFDEATNRDILRQIADKLNPGGRLVLDIYNRDFFQNHEGSRTFEKEGMTVTEEKQMTGPRLQVTLTYNEGESVDRFDWHLYTVSELSELLSGFGFREILACSDYSENVAPSPLKPRMQLVSRLA